MSAFNFRCLFCGEVLARVKPARGKITPISGVRWTWDQDHIRMHVVCTGCGQTRVFDPTPKREERPAA